MIHGSRLPAAALLVTLAACGGDSVGPGESANTMRITYTVAGTSDRYEARGELRSSVPPVRQTYAAGQRSAADGFIEVHSSAVRSDSVTDVVLIDVPRLVPGVAEIDPECRNSRCASVVLALEVDATNVSRARLVCEVEDGTVTVTHGADRGTRVAATFQGRGYCVGAPGAGIRERFVIRDGSFDVRLVDVQG